jgi:hypothetical protein
MHIYISVGCGSQFILKLRMLTAPYVLFCFVVLVVFDV